MAKKEMKKYEYVLDIRTPFIKKLYNEEDDYKTELLTPYETLEELKKLQKQLADLESKLAESEKKIYLEEYAPVFCRFTCRSCDAIKKIDQLKQQLAEKEQTIEEINKEFVQAVKDWKSLVEQKEKEIEDLKAQRHIYLNRSVEECNKITDLEFELQHKDQDKISFAVEKLQEVKNYIEQEIEDVQSLLDPIDYEDYRELLGVERGYKNSVKEIDNQIKELKERK